MKTTFLMAALLFFSATAAAQVHSDDAETRPLQSNASQQLPDDSPLSHLLANKISKSTALPWICPFFIYYQNSNPTEYFHEEFLPTSEWAMFIPKPAITTQATVCTVWTVKIDFQLTAPASSKDTIKIFVRKGTPPYTQIFSTYFLARSGQNQGFFEIDPPVVPPFNVRSIVGPPMHSLMIGYKVVGDSTHKVKFRFTTPSLSSTTHHSYKFLTPTSVTTASAALGFSADWSIEARLCCDKWVPVKLSTFNAQVERNDVHLRWKTETETNSFSFEVQRSQTRDGRWESRGFLPGHGTTSLPQEYEFQDRYSLLDFPAGAEPTYWYRLVQRDFDGTEYQYAPIEVQLSEIAESGFELYPAYPNPLRLSDGSVTRIRYRVPYQSNVRMTVHDVLGREVAVLADNLHEAGAYENVWYPSDGNYLSGQYFLRMQAGTYVQTQKISIIH